ncbi:hypothetical protein BATDEDRAFT_35133 [Batrachochytrium dendrobatidis JAM81]|uniref:Ureidoglycolate hydrolase n=2 Tax=Batrachochytrium dendrobatidis TaxID=109871 RepID=F4P2L7_BATDJ|nr:uncharacterized protein BATDEDRAFT_35133 [Batrachochytrium dendrobatidis JAM81]KAJ8326354.1 hypothetical protein O5D80_005111 [Batrachochytrium dendrobatidis]OAJ40988.1 ureidoglycolate hydrolase [Batrachochytrium dendrobatidis JEL423]EGF80232.1 hypothetical protein BATDEDRAFT_35133 [Batrachochytrium dendrobatidis JAM81]KAK5670135.1 hypothetical protein QVD99_003456 [Batrachochytrium dendrobatidis]OAJ40989.1 ureidoglycolate hydrolase, variant 1 [Batrachochytrium dendrobatidis JEL423]|eukprot:XP_006679117.1 hypothetical protein BATDEDRAFT_35133 [Batrachochytrium dendrobatidis JAM81]
MSGQELSAHKLPLSITVQPLERNAFLPYGDVIDAGSQITSDVANQGTAKRFNHLTSFVNMRTASQTPKLHQQLPPSLTQPAATPNLCIFQTQPATMPFSIKLLERHKYSTQMFIPMVQPTKEMFLTMNAIPSYYVIVALNDPITDKPDWSTLCAFQATTVQAFNYNAGVWHHPMVGLGSTIDFVCLVWERREFQTEQDEDTEEVHLAANEYILLQPYSPKMEHSSVSILQ